MARTTSIYYLLDPLDDLVLGGVAGQPGVYVSDDGDADCAEEVIPEVTTNTGRGLGG